MLGAVVVAATWAFAVATASPAEPPLQACTDGTRALNVGFYAFFAPVSYSSDPDPSSAGFNHHRGYEADLLTALEAMRGAGLSFSRRGIPRWDDIWLQAAGPHYDLVGGGITILDERTLDADGNRVVGFSSGHVTFRQSLLVREADARRLADYGDLTAHVHVGVLAGTTGEFRLLELTGIVNASGVLAAGTRIEAPGGVVVADGTPAFAIAPGGTSPMLAGRRRLLPPGMDQPQVIYLGDDAGESALLDALRGGRIDAIARGEIGNRDAAADGDLVVSILDTRSELGGFALPAGDSALIACIDKKLDWLTDDRRIGYAEWREDPSVFMRRADQWSHAKDRP